MNKSGVYNCSTGDKSGIDNAEMKDANCQDFTQSMGPNYIGNAGSDDEK